MPFNVVVKMVMLVNKPQTFPEFVRAMASALPLKQEEKTWSKLLRDAWAERPA